MRGSQILWLGALATTWLRPALGQCDESDAPEPARPGEALDAPAPGNRTNGYEYKKGNFSLRLGGGILIDYVRYHQNEASKEQLELRPESGIRDLRGLASGQLFWSRLSYTLGYMFEDNDWFFRQTGLKLQIPELGGYLFVGRTKEGFSTNKFMVGYHGWFNERAAVNDAFLPILADGLRWTASAFGGSLIYNVGAFADPLSDKEKFNKNDWQVAARAVWLPFAGDESGTVLHLAAEVRHAGANEGVLRYRSKPESFLTDQFAVNTGEFPASRSTIFGGEAYFSRAPFSGGTEYFVNHVISDFIKDPTFHGGEIFVAYMFTGESHPYNTDNGLFGNVVPNRTFFHGGTGAIELAVRCSYVDLDSKAINGNKFFRFTPILNWYLTDTLRLEAAYGYGVLERFDEKGALHFFQTRVQLAI